MTRIFIIIIFLATAVLVFSIWTRPLWDGVQALRAEKNAASDAFNRLYSLRQTRDNLLSDYNTISRDDLKRLGSFLPSSPERGKLLVEFENLSKAHNIILKRVDIAGEQGAGQGVVAKSSAAKSKGPFGEMPFTILVVGSYDSFIPFLTDLEKSLRLIDVDDISFSSGEKDAYDFTIKAHAYLLNQAP